MARAQRETRGRNIAQREERVGDLEGETAAAVDLRALTREEGEAEGRREEQSRAAHQEEREAEQGIRRGAEGSRTATRAVVPSCGGGIAVGSGGADGGRELGIGTSMKLHARRGRSTWSA